MEIDEGNKEIRKELSLSIPELTLKNLLEENCINLEKLILLSSENSNKILPFPNNYLKEDIIEEDLDKFSQYNSIYITRFEQTKDNLKSQAKIKWKNIKICDNILDLKGEVRL